MFFHGFSNGQNNKKNSFCRICHISIDWITAKINDSIIIRQNNPINL